jgi:hypothetical protein
MDTRFDNGRKLRNPAATSLEPLRIRVTDAQHAVALTRELDGIGKVDVNGGAGTWEIALHGSKTDGVVVKVLDAVRRTLAGDSAASAEMLLDGHKYSIQGE